MDPRRREFLEAVAVSSFAAIGALPSSAEAKARIVNDVTKLNPISVAEERRPRSTAEVQALLSAWTGPISVGGGRFSMGGQIAMPDSMHLDMRAMNQVVAFDAGRRVIRVQAGITWRDIQDAIDPHDLSVKIMQSYSNFTVGGSVSVNCHGRYVGRGPLINSVRAVQLVTAQSEVMELTRSENADLFRAVFGGYGGLGVVTEVELELDTNSRIERVVQDISLEQYPEFFRRRVQSEAGMVLHNADLAPPNFDLPRAISWVKTDKPATEQRRLIPRGLNYSLEKNAIWAMTELPVGTQVRTAAERKLETPAVVWRNHEASLDTASLEPRTRIVSTYLLQEYFIPVANFVPFAHEMARILKARKVNALNVSVRHSSADTQSLMTWAPVEVFSFVLYYKQRATEQAKTVARAWTRELIDRALSHGGRYYLPYRLDATRVQFDRAYPEAQSFAKLKARVDPGNRLRNMLWEAYL